MTNLQIRKPHGAVLAPKPKPHRRPPMPTCREVHGDAEAVIVQHDFISQADLEVLRSEALNRRVSSIDLLIKKQIYTKSEINHCLATEAWLKRSTAKHLDHITSAEALTRYACDFALQGYAVVPHFLPRDQFYALDLALHRISLAHVDQDPSKHKLYHSIGGQLLYDYQAVVDLNGHPALLAIARHFLGDDLVQGKHYLKVDDPYQCRGMFGHTHAETHYECLSSTLYMFLYMDATSHRDGGFQVIPGSHGWYSCGPGRATLYKGQPLDAENGSTSKASLVHDAAQASRLAGYESLEMPGNTLLMLSPFLWHAVRPVMHRRRLMFMGYFNAASLTREFVMTSDYFGSFPYDLRQCDLSLLTQGQRELLAIHLDREAWLQRRGL